MPDIDTPQSPDPVDQVAASAVTDHRAFGTDDDGAGIILFKGIKIGKGLDQVIIGGKNIIGRKVLMWGHGSGTLCKIGKLC